MSYCLLADCSNYLNTSTSAPDAALLQRMLDGASARIDSRTGRSFYAAADSTRYHDFSGERIKEGLLWLDGDLSYITTVLNGDSQNITADIVQMPRRGPAYGLALKTSSGNYWTFGTDWESAIAVTGRWAYMDKITFSGIARVTGTALVTATLSNAAPVSVGQSIEVVGVADTSFNGTFTVTAATPTTLVWSQAGASDTDTNGYILAAPQDIVTACRRLAAWMYRQKDTQQGDIDRPLLMGDGSVLMPTTLPQDVEMILQPYTRDCMTSTIAAIYSALDSMTVTYTDMNGASATATCYTLSEMLDSVETAHTPCRLLMLPTDNLTVGPGTMGEAVYTIQDLFLLESVARTEGSKVIMPVLLSYVTAYQDAILKKWSFQSTWQTEALTLSVVITPGKYTYPANSGVVWYGVMVQITINEVI